MGIHTVSIPLDRVFVVTQLAEQQKAIELYVSIPLDRVFVVTRYDEPKQKGKRYTSLNPLRSGLCCNRRRKRSKRRRKRLNPLRSGLCCNLRTGLSIMGYTDCLNPLRSGLCCNINESGNYIHTNRVSIPLDRVFVVTTLQTYNRPNCTVSIPLDRVFVVTV